MLLLTVRGLVFVILNDIVKYNYYLFVAGTIDEQTTCLWRMSE